MIEQSGRANKVCSGQQGIGAGGDFFIRRYGIRILDVRGTLDSSIWATRPLGRCAASMQHTAG
jgi:hypothetical protein